MAKCIYVAPEVVVFSFDVEDVVRTSAEPTTNYGNEGAWNSNWTPMTGEEGE